MIPAVQRAERDRVKPKRPVPRVFGSVRVFSSDNGWLWHVDMRPVHRFAVIQTFHNWEDAIRYAIQDQHLPLLNFTADAVFSVD